MHISQDAFDLYHIVREIAEEEYKQSNGGASQLPPSGHAVAGSIASALSNAITYPLDLIITRLQTQRRLQKSEGEKGDHERQDEYEDLTDAVKKIYTREGGLSGFYAGLLQDTAKTVLDSFLFFLLYNFLREKRLKRFARIHNGKTPSLLPAVDELGIGFVAGSLTRFVTTPISNVVTRKQTGAMAAARRSDVVKPVSAEGGGHGDAKKASGVLSTRDIIRDIHAQKGVKGFWSGYSASLILTLNPSLTFFLFEALKRILLPKAKRANPPASATFFLAAISKSIASSVTYPFSLAKARMQAAGGDDDNNKTTSKHKEHGRTILHTVLYIAKSEGLPSLYEGLPPEILKGFLSHGLTMLVKQGIHNTVLQLYLTLSNLLQSLRRSISGTTHLPSSLQKTRLRKLRQQSQTKNKEYYDMAIDRVGEVAESAAAQINGVAEKVSDAGRRSGANKMLEKSGELVQEVMEMANETAELIRDYVDDGDDENGGGGGV